jgi:oligopeptide/dipeptide ABC transporter ATP-binding protein
MSSEQDPNTILALRGLSVSFASEEGPVCAVDHLDLDLRAGETLALVGESGCGKTTAALSVLRLLPEPGAKIEAGRILYQGEDLLAMPEKRLQAIRGNRISMVFQEPMTSLNPVMTAGSQVAEVFRRHRKMGRKEARHEALRLLQQVGIPAPEARMHAYPHDLSGGMKQRIMLAMALALKPDLLIADEPTTAVDVTTQAQVLELLQRFQREHGMAILLITHDLSVVAEMADRVAVMYAARIVEQAPRTDLFETPRHPYTAGLFESLPGLEAARERLREIPGVVPDAACFPEGCRFHPRCPKTQDRCIREEPRLRELEPARRTACHFPL